MPPSDYEAIRQIIRDELEPLKGDVNRIDRHITGGEDPANGLIIKVDRHGQQLGVIKWLGSTALVALIGLVATKLWGLFAHGPGSS